MLCNDTMTIMLHWCHMNSNTSLLLTWFMRVEQSGLVPY